MSFENYDLDKVVDKKHPLRKIAKLIAFKSLTYRIKDCASELGRDGYGLEVAIKGLFLQFYYDKSDRQIGGIFSFVDASILKTKETTWAERDKALADGEDKLNNRNISGYSADPNARFCAQKTAFEECLSISASFRNTPIISLREPPSTSTRPPTAVSLGTSPLGEVNRANEPE
ncbi:MAG: hypothetical protein WC890_06295 [Candidatus Margulisiibacteriota bacterium]